MPRSLTSPEHLFDRTWRPGHPFGPRLSRARRLGMAITLLVLGGIIGGYWYVTDSVRVRNMAMGYLSTLIGGRVTIGGATLSIFQGLRLNDVRIYSTVTASPGSESDDALLFRAQAFVLHADPKALLRGKLEATQIVAIDPYVRLTEDLDTGEWEHQKLHGTLTKPRVQKPNDSDKPPRLPEVVLRNAQVEYSQVSHGVRTTRGTVTLEGQLLPGLQPDVYLFKLQSRGESEGIGPSVDGKIVMTTGAVTASLRDFRFGADLEAMLPAQVRKWWKDHALAGRVDVPELTYRPPQAGSGKPMSYRAEIDVRGVGLAVQPNELLGSDETERQRWSSEALDAMRVAGLDASGFVSQLHAAITPTPILMHQVTGKFIFTEDTIEVRNVAGYVESSGLLINGRINNYARPSEATASIRVASLDNEDINIPALPRYMNSMPLVVQEIYDHLRPQGNCRFWIQVNRDTPSAKPTVDGEINILGGTFIFDQFPYPISGAVGKIVIGRNPATNIEQLQIIDVEGHGPDNGVNKDARVKIDGLVSPFGAETGVNVTVIGDNVIADPLVIHSLPPPTQEALRMFDAPGKGEFPKFRGGFRCDIERPKGLNQRWKFATDIRLDDASGVMVAFPYPMSGVSGQLHVTDDHIDIKNTTMRQNGATLQLDGTVAWGNPNVVSLSPMDRALLDDSRGDIDPATGRARLRRSQADSDEPHPPLRTDLHVIATNVPIDDALIDALPPNQRGWLKKSGAIGRFDLQGELSPQKNSDGSVTSSEPTFDFHIALHDGAVWPIGKGFAASAMNGKLELTPGRVVIESMNGLRGTSPLSLRGNVDWSNGPAKAAIVANATDLALDSALYSLLPGGAKQAWDAVHPQGAVDASLDFSGAVEDPNAPPTYVLTLNPKQLSITPNAVPYLLTNVTGTVVARPDQVVLTDIAAVHDKTKVRLSGTGALTPSKQTWDFKLAADDVPLDDAFNRAAPPALAELIKSTKLTGRIGFTFDKLTVATSSPEPATSQPTTTPMSAPTTTPMTAPLTTPMTAPLTTPTLAAQSKTPLVAPQPPTPGDNVDVDFAVRLNAQNASLDVGVPITDAQGSAAFSGAVRGGKLDSMDGSLEFGTLTLAAHPATNLRATLQKPPGQDLFQLSKLETHIADGELAGQFGCALGANGPTRYALSLVLRNADVVQLTGEAAPDFRGRLSASMSLEGGFNDVATRRGRGDVSVSGSSMYRIPLLLGLFQITNLSLPITSPFNDATARYSVDGNKVAFESIVLRAKDMMMEGSGHLDYGTKQVQLTFTTDNTTWPKLPIIGDLIKGAQHELLQINVKGTLEEPKVTAGAFSTFTTTIDEVFRGTDQGTAYNKPRK